MPLSDADVWGDAPSVAAPTASGPPSGGVLSDADVWGQPAMAAAPRVQGSGLAANLGAGFTEAFTGLPGMLSKAAHDNPFVAMPEVIAMESLARNPIVVLAAKKLGITPGELAGRDNSSHLVNQALGPLNPEQIQAVTPAERIARGIGSGLSAAVLPEKGAVTVGSMIRNGLVGGSAGAGAATAAEVAPDELKPAASIVGGLAGGLGAAGAISGMENAARTAAERPPGVMKKATGPLAAAASQGSAEQQAAEILASRATDIKTVRGMLAGGADELVPGSTPTTFQQTGDLGLGSLEREVAARNPDLFAERQSQQNTARLDSLTDIQAGANPNDVAGFLKGQFDDLDAATQKHVDDLTSEAQAKTAALGGEAPPEVHGEQVRSILNEAETAARTREGVLWKAVDPQGDLTGNTLHTSSAAKQIVGELPKTAKPMAGEEAAIFDAAKELPALAPVQDLIALRSRLSTELRNELIANGRSPSYARLSQLRGAIQDNLASSISQEITSQTAAKARGEIADIGIIGRLQAWVDEFRASQQIGERSGAGVGSFAPEGAGLSARDGDAGLPAAGRPGNAAGPEGLPANAGRADGVAASLRGDEVAPIDADLQTLRKAARDYFNQRLMGKSVPSRALAGDVRMVGSGRDKALSASADPRKLRLFAAIPDMLRDGELVSSRAPYVETERPGIRAYHTLRAPVRLGDALHDVRVVVREARDGHLYYDHMVEGGGSAGTRGAGTANKGRGGLAGAEPPSRNIGSRAASGNETRPTFGPDAAQRLAEATEATKARARTFGAAPVGSVVAKGGGSDLFKLPDGRVPAKFFHPGPTGFTDMQALYAAVGEGAALPVIKDYAAASLRKAAAREDGALDPGKYLRWKASHADALRALPADVRDGFENAAAAARTMESAAAQRVAALKNAQAGAIGKVMKAEDPDAVVRTVGAALESRTGAAELRFLAKTVAKDPMAKQGLRQAVADYVSRKFVGNIEAGASGTNLIKADAFQTFVRSHRAALEEVFTPAEVKNLEAIAADIHRSKRSETALKLPGGSNTAQDAYALSRTQRKTPSIMSRLLGGAAGWGLGGPGGAFIGELGIRLSHALREAGIARIDDLVTQAVLHPEIARDLLKRLPGRPDTGSAISLSRSIRATVPGAMAQTRTKAKP